MVCALVAVALVARGTRADEPAAEPAAPPRVSARIDALLDRAAESGMPVLVVAAEEDCRETPLLQRRFATDPVLQGLAARFVPLPLTMSGNDGWEWRAFRKLVDAQGRRSPWLIVIRADGQVLSSGDPPADLAGFLQAQLQLAGPPLPAAQAEQFRRRLAEAEKLVATGDLPAAARALVPAARSASHARSVVAARARMEEIATRALDRLGEARKAVGTDAAGLAAAVELCGLAREFRGLLADVVRQAEAARRELEADPLLRPVIGQAREIDQANEAAAQSVARGRTLFARIAERHAGTPAAELAAARIAALDGAAPADTPIDEPASAPAPAAP